MALDDERFASLATSIRSGEAVDVRASTSIRPYLLAALLDADDGLADRPALVVAADDVGARDLARALGAYLAPRRVRYYPSRGTGYESHLAPPPHLVGLRIGALDALTAEGGAGEDPPVVVASAVALAEAVPDAALRPAGFVLHRAEEIDLGDVSELLVEAGYERVDQVDERGRFAIRGDILDVFPATEERAARLELFGDEIESIRWFSTFTQRSLGEAERIELAPAAELALEHRELAEVASEEEADPAASTPRIGDLLPVDSFRAPLDLIGDDAAVLLAAAEEIPTALRDHWDDVTTAMHDSDARHLYVDVAEPLAERAVLTMHRPAADPPAAEAELSEPQASGHPAKPDASAERWVFRAQSPTSAARNVAEAESQLERELRSAYRVVVTFVNRGEAERTRYNLNRVDARFLDGAPADRAALYLAESSLAEGFVSPDLRLAVIPFRRLVHRRRPVAAPAARGRLASFADLRVGDFVVHSDHGIARFAGFETKTLAGVTRDYLELEYRGEDKVFAPTDQLAKITRYVGAGGDAPQLSALGSKRWEAVKSRARRAARLLAGELLNLYAERQARRGHSFEPDGEWQLELERSFPYRETADQIDAIDAVKADMESERPMDRLICGDVGYGKTEVALRAALKAAGEGKQVMMLVPTTILAQQHLGTFRERLAEFPLEIEVVSRLRKPAEVREALARFADGKLDVVLGTHRLLSRDVRAKDLGLVIVDEEQRFGVKQKELLRQLKLKVDVLSLSATPIPRTLQMSLAGLRDISVIETPPEGRRPVRTYVGPYDEELVRRAIQREVAREGQVFFLHNRIDTLTEVAERLRALLPKVRFAEAHGQMDETMLERTMLGFLRGDADCLVATTIIESGLDIPQANTLIVERADHLGLAQAYQIRGRVGRSKERAFAYMLYPSEEAISADAGARLATLSDHTELGSGFAIAMRDLELRGAGDLLGDEQSGHVAAVGFELYVALLDEAVEALRAAGDGEGPAEAPVRLEVDVDAYLPPDYIPFEAAKIDVHRRIAGARAAGELRALGHELRDRFGPVPEPVENLLALQRARIELGGAGARTAELRGGRLSITPVELEAAAVGRVREQIPEAIYELRTRTLSLRVGDDPQERLAAVLELTEALVGALAEPAPLGAV
ncbi:MAG: transcription-repair coupling factor [Solirubrobacterales bacterium]|nr:transcription-repair coupling factor [Solirubrobacterales bacterium]